MAKTRSPALYSRGRGRAIPAAPLPGCPWAPRRCREAAPPRADGLRRAPRGPRAGRAGGLAAAPTRGSVEAAAEAREWAGGSAGPANHRPAAGEGSPRPLGSCPRRGPRRRRALLTGAASPASCRRRRPPSRAPGRGASTGPRASSEFLLGQRPQTRSYYCSRARSASPPPHPTSRSPPLPSSAGRLIPRYTAGFRAETERASPAARRAGGRVVGTSSPSTEARAGRAAAPTPEAARRPLSFVLGRELPAAAQPITTWPPPSPQVRATSGALPPAPQSHAHLPLTDLPPSSPAPPRGAASTSALG